MAAKTPKQAADEVSEVFLERLAKQLRQFDIAASKEEISQYEHFGEMVIEEFLNNRHINNDFKTDYNGKYAVVANIAFQCGALFQFMWRKDRASMISGEYPAVVILEGPTKYFETIWTGSTMEQYGEFIRSMSNFWQQYMKEYLDGEDREEYAKEALMAFFRAGATVFFAWMQ